MGRVCPLNLTTGRLMRCEVKGGKPAEPDGKESRQDEATTCPDVVDYEGVCSRLSIVALNRRKSSRCTVMTLMVMGRCKVW